jgi:hypothetical protein
MKSDSAACCTSVNSKIVGGATVSAAQGVGEQIKQLVGRFVLRQQQQQQQSMVLAPERAAGCHGGVTIGSFAPPAQTPPRQPQQQVECNLYDLFSTAD